MWERILVKTKILIVALRPLLLLILLANLALAARQLAGVYVTKPDPPLVRLANTAASNEAKDLFKVNVSGAVNSPGVYSFPANTVVADALNAAGGLNSEADHAYVASQINLAKTLSGGEHIYIPSISEKKLAVAQSSPSSSGSIETTGLVINLNTASREQLETLPSVGPSLAEKIIAARPYKSVDDLNAVSGIGEATFGKLKGLVTV